MSQFLSAQMAKLQHFKDAQNSALNSQDASRMTGMGADLAWVNRMGQDLGCQPVTVSVTEQAPVDPSPWRLAAVITPTLSGPV